MKIKDAFYFSIFKRKTKLVSWPMKKNPKGTFFFQNKKTATSHASFSRSTLVPLSSFSIVSPSFSEFCLTHAVSFFGFFPPSLTDCVFFSFFLVFLRSAVGRERRRRHTNVAICWVQKR